MKAVVCTKYGAPGVLKFCDIKKPLPKNNEILIRLSATTVTSADKNIRAFTVPLGFWIIGRIGFGLSKPKCAILGTEFAGEIKAVGSDVTRFKNADLVFGSTGANFGSYAEYICLSEKAALALIPTDLSFEQAAAVPFGALTALYFLRDKAKICRGHKILIIGASGGVGTAAIQLAKYYGAEVTGVCSTTNVDLVRSLGADKVIDYTTDDFTDSRDSFDVILDLVATSSFSKYKQILEPKGVYLLVSAGLPQFIQMMWTSIFGYKKIICGMAPDKSEDLLFIKALMDKGIIKSVIDRSYPIEQIVEAHEYVDTGHKKGSVVIRF